MSDSLRRYVSLMGRLYRQSSSPPKLLHRARAILRVLSNEPLDQVAAEEGIAKHWLKLWSDSIRDKGLYYWLDRDEPSADAVERARAGIAQMLVAELAERHFEQTAHAVLGAGYVIRDDRHKRSDTDYILQQENGFRVCRFNIKFHGTLFREASQYVGLEPTDCFALATYKIANALEKHHNERLPYVFLVLSAPEFPTSDVARGISDEDAWLCALSDRATEEAVARALVEQDWVASLRDRIKAAQFRAFSARRAHNLMREKLFERVFALRQRAFNQKF